MPRSSVGWLLPALLAVAAATASAQGPDAPPRPAAADPLDPTAAVPPIVYRSVLTKPASPPAAGSPSWREVNDNVGRIGGWRAYAREAAAPEPAAPASAPMPHPPGSATSHGGRP